MEEVQLNCTGNEQQFPIESRISDCESEHRDVLSNEAIPTLSASIKPIK